MPGSTCVPQAQWSQTVGVDVFWGSLQLGERRYLDTAVVGLFMIDLEKERSIGLDDQRPARHGVAVGESGAEGLSRLKDCAGVELGSGCSSMGGEYVSVA